VVLQFIVGFLLVVARVVVPGAGELVWPLF